MYVERDEIIRVRVESDELYDDEPLVLIDTEMRMQELSHCF